ncbi:hypothetical protein BO71DRAFT_426442 [Aspergillus ellipticus CBS 707.79]|uniref:Uncharacterized protein n=1 Tax=Aspergillus ellipticus CBS 707.79 TaxID=1448320 RepID=A0A319DL10_9EURO|nr:hypothetical protein BO71DRAFT_426442 [Aspergillus ellipticus CBS 707.79]
MTPEVVAVPDQRTVIRPDRLGSRIGLACQVGGQPGWLDFAQLGTTVGAGQPARLGQIGSVWVDLRMSFHPNEPPKRTGDITADRADEGCGMGMRWNTSEAGRGAGSGSGMLTFRIRPVPGHGAGQGEGEKGLKQTSKPMAENHQGCEYGAQVGT